MSTLETPAVRSAASVATPQATRYLTLLCKHFQHKCPVTLDGSSGRIAFGLGECRLHAADGVLTLTLQAPDTAQMTQLQDVAARHLRRFAFREDLAIAWQAAPDAAPPTLVAAAAVP